MTEMASSAGDVITYTITVRNTGNVALENIVLSDVQKRGAYNTGSVLALIQGQHSPPQLMDLMRV